MRKKGQKEAEREVKRKKDTESKIGESQTFSLYLKVWFFFSPKVLLQ